MLALRRTAAQQAVPLPHAQHKNRRLLSDGLIREMALTAKDDERRRSYELTAFGRDVARAEAARLEHTLAIARRKALFKHVAR